jgi:hypothetical protein
MNKCPCGKKICRVTTTNSYFFNHCSHYCWIYYQNPEAYPSHVYGNGSPHHRNHFRRPLISADCEGCGEAFTLSHDLKKGQKIFCSRDCSISMFSSKKNARRDFALLKLLKVHGELTAHQLVNFWPDIQRGMSQVMVSQIFRANGYLRRNVVQIVSNSPRVYRINPNITEPLAKVMVSKQVYE